MPVESWTAIVSTSMVPVAIISASALLCLAFYNRLASVVSRLRSFQRERLRELEEYAQLGRTGREDAAAMRHHQQVLEMLEGQSARVYRRAKRVRAGLLCLLGAIACLTLCSLSLGLTVLAPSFERWAGYAAEAWFIIGMLLLLSGTLCGIAELLHALDPVQLESQFVTRISRELESEINRDSGHSPDGDLPIDGLPIDGSMESTDDKD